MGEFRAFGPDAAAAGMDFGTDLSFTPQELAAGAAFSYNGRRGTPVTITREAGANYVRMRVWVTRPPSATWPVTWPCSPGATRPG